MNAPIDDDVLRRQLKELPYFRALLRSIEARFYRDLLPLAEPVLDLGCGDGHFAAAALRGTTRPLKAGVDPKGCLLGEARQRGAYRGLAQACGHRLPFAARSFSTVVSNSVLEHIPRLDPVLAEVARVLRPGGRFIFCVPSDRFTNLLLIPHLLRTLPVPLERLAASYERRFSRVCRHYHYDSLDVWRLRLQAAGLHLVDSASYVSARAQHAVEIGHYLGAPSLVARRLTGRWILAPFDWNLAVTERAMRPHYEETPPAEGGAYLFMVAEKRKENGA